MGVAKALASPCSAAASASPSPCQPGSPSAASGFLVVRATNELSLMSPPVTVAVRHGSVAHRAAGIGSRSARATSSSNSAATSRPCSAQRASRPHHAAKRSKVSSYASAASRKTVVVETEWSRIPSSAIARMRLG